jgi:hypothetical protein
MIFHSCFKILKLKLNILLSFERKVNRVTQVTKVFPTVALKDRVFHPDSNDVHISSLR